MFSTMKFTETTFDRKNMMVNVYMYVYWHTKKWQTQTECDWTANLRIFFFFLGGGEWRMRWILVIDIPVLGDPRGLFMVTKQSRKSKKSC